MPELPEIETTRRALAPRLEGRRMTAAVVREPRLRYRISGTLEAHVAGARVTALVRRGKYLIVDLDTASWLRVVWFRSSSVRLTDPRRFGCVLIGEGEPQDHPLLRSLGVEPLGPDLTGRYLYRAARRRRVPVKAFLMDARVVVGIGNIYANESLYRAGIRPDRAASRISRERYGRLAEMAQGVLSEALAAGGTTLRDYVSSDGQTGRFATTLSVYGGGQCPRCSRPLQKLRIAQRATWLCPRCQA